MIHLQLACQKHLLTIWQEIHLIYGNKTSGILLILLCVGLVIIKKKKRCQPPQDSHRTHAAASIGGQISCNDEPLVSEGPRWARKGLLSSGEQA